MPDDFENETHFYPLKEGDPHYAAIGRVASAWSYFEFHINQLIWHLSAQDSERGACVTSHIYNVNSRLKALLALIELEHDQLPISIREGDKDNADSLPKLKAKLKTLADKKVEPLSRKRNRVVHDTWMFGKVTGAVAQLTSTAERKLDYGFRPAKIDDVNKWWKDILELDAEFEKLAARIQASIHLLKLQAQSKPAQSQPPTRR